MLDGAEDGLEDGTLDGVLDGATNALLPGESRVAEIREEATRLPWRNMGADDDARNFTVMEPYPSSRPTTGKSSSSGIAQGTRSSPLPPQAVVDTVELKKKKKKKKKAKNPAPEESPEREEQLD